jgi:ferrous iron transport protein A
MAIELLSNLKEGECGLIVRYTDDKMACKLLTMGVLPGKELMLIRRVSLKGGLYLKVGEQTIAIREEEAKHIEVIVND